MTESIKFSPRGRDWHKNLTDYIAAAKALPFMPVSGIDWGADCWNLSGLAKPERPGLRPTVRFGGGRSQEPSLTGAMGDFARAYVAFKIAEEFGRMRQVGKFTKPVIMMRVLAGVMAETGPADPGRVTPSILDATLDFAAARAPRKPP